MSSSYSSYFMSSGGATDTIFSASSADTAGSVVFTVFNPLTTYAYVTTHIQTSRSFTHSA
jgi:hypothetical protein